jgi:hypothetical protein
LVLTGGCFSAAVGQDGLVAMFMAGMGCGIWGKNKAPDNFPSLTGAPSLDASDSLLHHAILSNPLDTPS